MTPAPVSAPTPFWRGMIRYESAKVAPWLALRNGLGVAIPLAIGVAMGHATSGLIGATGALNVAFSDGSDPYRHRLRRMLAASLACALAVVAGGLSGRHQALTVLLTGACGFGAGMMVALGTEATDIANVTLVTLIVFSAQAMTARQAAPAGLAALGGGLLQTILALTFWPFRRYQPERRVLGHLYLELARVAPGGPRVSEAPPASAEMTQAQTALAALGGDHSIEAERCLALLSQAERIRLALLTLARLRTRIGRETGAELDSATLDRGLEIAGHVLTSVGESLESPNWRLRTSTPASLRNYALWLLRFAGGSPRRPSRGCCKMPAGKWTRSPDNSARRWNWPRMPLPQAACNSSNARLPSPGHCGSPAPWRFSAPI